MGTRHNSKQIFTPVRIDLECVLFFKTKPPINPVDFVHRICDEIVSTPGIRRMRFVNRLSPVSLVAKATEKGLEELGKTVLRQHFRLASSDSRDEIKEDGNKTAKKGAPDSVSSISNKTAHNSILRS